MSKDELEITCTRCGQVVHHECNESLRDCLKHLLRIVVSAPEGLFNKDNDYYSPGDEKAPFFSESFLYTLLGKEDARTVLQNIRAVIRACGMDPDKLEEEAYRDEKEGVSFSKRKLMRHLHAEKERQGQNITVKLPGQLVSALDDAVKEQSAKSKVGYSSRSNVVAGLIKKNLAVGEE